MANILILGGGFAGMVAAEELAAAFIAGKHQITLVSRKPQFVFYPALVQVAFGKLEPASIRFDLAAKLTQSGVRFVEGDVVSINAEAREVQIYGDDFDGNIHYDYLLVALGRQLDTAKAPGFFEHAHHVLGVEAALKFGAAVKNFKHGDIVVGICPGGRLPVPPCETAFALTRRFQSEIEKGLVSISIIFPETVEAAFGGAKISHELESAFAKHNINLVTNFAVGEITDREVIATGGQIMTHNLLMLVPPFRGQALLSRMGEQIADKSGYAKVSDLMKVNAVPRIYAAGDVVAFTGPKFAHMAVRQAKVAAQNIISEILGEAPRQRYYHEINAVIDEGGSDSIHLHYGIWDDEIYQLQHGAFWSWAKNLHDRYWRAVHKTK